jgi:hypothetical protein
MSRGLGTRQRMFLAAIVKLEQDYDERGGSVSSDTVSVFISGSSRRFLS